MKQFLVEDAEKETILTMHKSFIKEQSSVTDDLEKLRKSITAGCLTGGKLQRKKSTGQYFYTKPSKSKPDTNVYFYSDMTYSFSDGSKKGKWKCDIVEPVEPKVDPNQPAKLQEYKNQGFQEYKDVVLKTKVDDPKFYQVVVFKGVENDKLYRPLYSMNEVGKLENWPADSEQRKILDQLVKDGYVINPSQADLMKGDLEPYTPPNIDPSLFPNGLKVYRDINKQSQSDVSASQTTITSSTVGAQNCEKNVQLYWDSYKNNIPPKGTKFDNLKNVVQACANQNMYRWKDIGGVLGIGGGARHLDNILEVMTNKRNEYEKVRLPGNGTPWALNAPRIQGRGR